MVKIKQAKFDTGLNCAQVLSYVIVIFSLKLYEIRILQLENNI